MRAINSVGLAAQRRPLCSVDRWVRLRASARRQYNFCGVGDSVFFNADWEAVYRGTTVACTAVVRKVIRDGKICEKYHRVNAAQIVEQAAPGA